MKKALYETTYKGTKKFTAVEELDERDFERRGFNPKYYTESLLGDITAYRLLNGDIAEAESASCQITGRWNEEIYKAITWE